MKSKSSKKCFCCNFRTANVILMGIGFLILFSAYNSAQNLSTSINHRKGFISLSIIYFTFAFSNLFMSPIIKKIGPRFGMILPSFFYILYFASNIKIIDTFFFTASALLGVAASMIWCANGVYLINCSVNENIGFHSGIFFFFYQMSQMIGNLIVGVVFQTGISHTQLFGLFILIGACGAVILSCLRRVIPQNFMGEKDLHLQSSSIPSKPKWKENFLEFFKIFIDLKMRFVLPLMAFSGVSQAFYFGILTSQMEEWMIPWVMSIFGLSDVVGSMINGRLSDRIGKKPIIISAVIFQFVGSLVMWFSSKSKVYLFFLAAISFGWGDSGFFTQIYAILGFLFYDSPESSFAIFIFMQGFFTGLTFLYGGIISLHSNILIFDAILFLSLFTILFLHYKITPIDLPKSTQKEIFEKTPILINQDQFSEDDEQKEIVVDVDDVDDDVEIKEKAYKMDSTSQSIHTESGTLDTLNSDNDNSNDKQI